jgi:hypothetical protein
MQILVHLISGNKNGRDGLNMKNKIDNANNCPDKITSVIPAIPPSTFPQKPTEKSQYII